MAERNSLETAKVEADIGNRILAELGLAVGVRASLGHVSMRVPGDPSLFVVKGRGYRVDVLSRMRPEDMVVCDLQGNWVDGPPYSLQCSEVKIHSCLYQRRPDVVSVVHVHPDYVVLMSVLEQGLKPMAQEGIGLVTTPLPVYPRTKIITSEAEGQEVARLLGNGVACLLLGHGAVTVSTAGGRMPCWRWCTWSTRRG
jgi:ribulose-5-phosphate 4-epimerase/fuculose-1-phosphate aldolase